MAMLSNLDLIRRVPLFSLLTNDQAQGIADNVVKRRYRRGEILVEHGRKTNALYILLTGRARVLTTSIAIPRSVEMQTWPSRTGAMSVAEATLRIAALPQGERGEDGWPLVQIRLAAGATAVDKRALDERAVGKRLRLLHVDIEKSVTQSDDAAPRARLEDVSPQIVFEDAWRQAHPEDPNIPPDVAAAFAEAVAAYTQVQA